MSYAVPALFFVSLTLAAAAAIVANVGRMLRGLSVPLTSDF